MAFNMLRARTVTPAIMLRARTVTPAIMLRARKVRPTVMMRATVVPIVNQTRVMMPNSLKPPAVKTTLLLDRAHVLVAQANHVKLAQKKEKSTAHVVVAQEKEKRERKAVRAVVRLTVVSKVRKKTRLMMFNSLRPPSVYLKLQRQPLRLKLLHPPLLHQPLR
jgi:hypothetical protein